MTVSFSKQAVTSIAINMELQKNFFFPFWKWGHISFWTWTLQVTKSWLNCVLVHFSVYNLCVILDGLQASLMLQSMMKVFWLNYFVLFDMSLKKKMLLLNIHRCKNCHLLEENYLLIPFVDLRVCTLLGRTVLTSL